MSAAESLSELVATDQFGRPAPGTIVTVDVCDYVGRRIAQVQGKNLPDVVDYWKRYHANRGGEYDLAYADVSFYNCTESAAGAPIPESATCAEIMVNLGQTLAASLLVVAS